MNKISIKNKLLYASFILRIRNPFSGSVDTTQDLFDKIITFLYYLAAPIIVILIVVSGMMFMFSRGEPAKIQMAKKILWWAIVGFSVILIGRGFVALIESVLLLGG